MRTLFIAALGALLVACAPTLQEAGAPSPRFSGPRLEKTVFVSFDGARLGLSRWDATNGDPWAVIIGLHGMDDYSNAFHLAGPWWAAHGVTTLAFDLRGFGRSPHRGIWAPEALDLEDIRTIAALAHRRWPKATIAVVGESLGGALAIEAFASDRPPDAQRLILLSPAVWGWSTQPFYRHGALWLVSHTAPGAILTPPRWLTRHIAATDNRAELIAMSRDPLMIWGARADALMGLVDTMQRASKEIADLKVPTLYAYGAHDEIIPTKAAFEAAARLPPSDHTAYYLQGWHLLLRDLHAKVVWADVLAFIKVPDAPLPSGAPPIPLPRSRAAKAAERASGQN